MRRVWKVGAAAVASVMLPLAGLAMAEPAFATDNGRIAYASGFGEGPTMIVDSTPGATPTKIGPDNAGRPSYAPDGTRIAEITMAGEVQTFLPDGTGLTTVATGAANDHVSPAWSPDSSMLAYWTGSADTQYSMVMNSSFPGGTPQLIFTVPPTDPPSFWPSGSITWSPDGSTLLYSADDARFSADESIYRVAAAPSSTPSRVTIAGTAAGTRDFGPSWSPDGTHFAFARQCFGVGCDPGSTGVWTANADGTGATQLTAAGINTPPSWSPDGTKVAFAEADLVSNLKVLNSAGSGQTGTVITSGADIYAPSWGPPLQTPAVITAPTVTGTAAIGQTLSAGQGTWSGMPTAFGHKWQRCTPGNAGSCTDIPSATGATYTVTSADAGKSLRAQVTATNAAGTGVGSSEMVGPVPAPLTPPAPKGVKTSATTKSVKTKWKKVSGATGYKVKVTGKSPKGKKVIKSKTTKKTSLTVKVKLKKRSTYKACVYTRSSSGLSSPSCKKGKVE